MSGDQTKPSPGEISDTSTPGQEEKLSEEAQRALSERPRISVRLRISLVLLLCFLLTCAITVALLSLISKISAKQRVLETVGNFQSEIQQARRIEKNFFLYETSLNEALDLTAEATTILNRNADEIRSAIGIDNYEQLRSALHRYQQQLDLLSRQQRESPSKQTPERQVIENELRLAGHEILRYAADVIKEERARMHGLMQTSTITAAGSLGLLLLFMVYMAGVLTRQILRPLGRYEKYTQRIAAGDFSPIMPARKYRDEFSNLAIAMNTMLRELKNHQEELAQSRKMAAVGTLTAGIAHELNNPLNNISLIVESLLDEFEDYSSAQKRKLLQDAFTQVERASGTVQNLLDFTRMDQPTLASINVNDVINATTKLIANELSLADVELELTLGQDLPPIQASPRNLQQVFLNLCLNSIQAMQAGGKLTIRSMVADDEFIRVDVVDTGVGIPADDLDKIFDPFFTTKDVGKGTGLGLSVSYGIVEKHKGRISVQSRQGVGTTFSVFLPYESESTRSL